MEHILKPRPELFAMGAENLFAAAHQELEPSLMNLCIEHGMPITLWPQISNTQVISRALLMTGYLPTFLPMSIGFDDTPLTKSAIAQFPESVIQAVLHRKQFGFVSHYCFTRGENWWQGPRSLLAHTLPLAAAVAHYTQALHRPALQTFTPPVPRGRGRPVKPNKLQPQSNRWAAWLAYCAKRKNEVAKMEDEIKAIKDEARCRIEAVQEKIEGHNLAAVKTFEQFKEVHTD